MHFRTTKKIASLFAISALLVISCMKFAQKGNPLTIRESPKVAAIKAKEAQEKTAIKLADGLQFSLWASDSLAPDPIAMSIDDRGRVFITRSTRHKHSEFDIRGHRDWMIESIGLQTVEDKRTFLHKIFAPERSTENAWLKDMNFDGSHDWRDLTVETEQIWRLEDTNKDGMADVSTRILNDFHEEVSDVAGGVLIREKDAFVAVAPDLWHLEDKNGDGIYEKKTSISHGYGVHIGFSGHNLSGIIEGPDGRIYWNMGDIGGNITTKDGKKYENPNSGFIARANPDGSDFEIFATGLRNTHEFVFDEYGNLISSDNDGDHPGESERLVHVVEGSDAGWRSSWQYGKYNDSKNNTYNVWMEEKLYVPRWEGQAAYIMPPIMNFHNGPTGMVYNPGTALGTAWKNKFFLAEFVGNSANSPVWAFGLKPKGASFELDGEKKAVSGILPTALQFGPDGALYVADWITGWDTKDYGRIWKLDVTKDKNDLEAVRKETQRLMQLKYATLAPETLYTLLSNADMRIRKKAQFELVGRGPKGAPFLVKAINQTDHQLARIHGIWGIGQLARMDKSYAAPLIPLLKDNDTEVIVQVIKMLGDAEIAAVSDELIALLKHPNDRIRFYAAEALGQLQYQTAVEPLLRLLQDNNDKDVYIRHASVLALARIGQTAPIIALARHESKALRTAAVLILRRLHNDNIALFLKDSDEYIVAEAARGINDDLSIPGALSALAATLKETKFTAEPLLRRAINAAQRVGSTAALENLIAFAKRTDISAVLKAEALAVLGTWSNPSVLDRVDGRFRGSAEKDPALLQSQIQRHIPDYLATTNSDVLMAVATLLANTNISAFNDQLANIYAETKDPAVKTAILPALNRLKYNKMESMIKGGMEDADESVRAVALGLLNDTNISKENLPGIVSAIFSRDRIKEQQQLLVVMSKLQPEKTIPELEKLIERLRDKKLSPRLRLELKEAVEATGSVPLKTQLSTVLPNNSLMDGFMETLYGGNISEGRNLFYYNSTAQCMRCHAIGAEGGTVGPNLAGIGDLLKRDQLLQAMIEPSMRLAPGFGNVSIKLKDGQQVFGILAKETAEALNITTSDAEPLIIPVSRIATRENLPSSMPGVGDVLSKREIRDLVEFLASLKK